jgi:type I restriction enzyme R subunit
MAETIENNIRRLIIDEMPTNPKYYEKMSILLDELIKERKADAKNYEKYLTKITELSKKVKNPAGSTSYPASMTSNAKRALYDNLEHDEQLALTVDKAVRDAKQDGWLGSTLKERQIKIALRPLLKGCSDEEFDALFTLIKNQHEYR